MGDDRVFHHYTLRIGDSTVHLVQEQPKWAAEYWAWKSTRNVPGHLDQLIDVQSSLDAHRQPTQTGKQRAAGSDSGAAAMRSAMELANDSGNAANVRKLVLNGTVIGEFIDEPLVPGATYGWSPETMHGVAFVGHNHKLTLMDIRNGDQQEVPNANEVLLPAWSLDGTRLAWLVKTGRKRYVLMQMPITLR